MDTATMHTDTDDKKAEAATGRALVPTATAKPSAERPSVSAPQDGGASEHPYEKLDRATRAVMAQATAGVSPHSIMATSKRTSNS